MLEGVCSPSRSWSWFLSITAASLLSITAASLLSISASLLCRAVVVLLDRRRGVVHVVVIVAIYAWPLGPLTCDWHLV
jgi:hypothetical protein